MDDASVPEKPGAAQDMGAFNGHILMETHDAPHVRAGFAPEPAAHCADFENRLQVLDSLCRATACLPQLLAVDTCSSTCLHVGDVATAERTMCYHSRRPGNSAEPLKGIKSGRADNMRNALSLTQAGMLERISKIERYTHIRDEAQRALDKQYCQLHNSTQDVGAIVQMDSMGMQTMLHNSGATC